MTKLSDDEREELGRQLGNLAKAESAILAARKPFDDALAAIEEIRGTVLERFGVEEPIGDCDACETLLLEGDMGHRCGDGPLLCADCAPTWGDLKRQIEEPDICTGEAPDLDEDYDDGITRKDKLAAIEAHVAGGGSLDDKIIHPL